MSLSAVAVRGARPREKPYKLADSNGLYLQVMPSGTRHWRMNYRFQGKQRTLTFGPYPLLTLAEAREKRDETRKLLLSGVDPVVKRQQKKLADTLAAASSFQAVAEEWVAKQEREGLAEVTISKIRWLLAFAYPSLGKRPIGEITTLELLAALREVEGRGRHESARRMRSVMGRVFRYAAATGRATHDPSHVLRDALTTPKVVHRAAITEERQVGALLRAIEGFDGHEITRLALRLAPHVFVRPGELRHAEWTEFDFAKAIWTIPAAKMKLGRPIEQGLMRQESEGRGSVRRDFIPELQRRELRRAAAQLSRDLGLGFTETQPGERIRGTYKRPVDLAGGRYALIERAHDFSLVPWRTVLEKQLGLEVSGQMVGDSVHWTFGRQRSGPEI
jgi:integrase